MQNKPFEIILHAGRVISLRSWVAKKSCHNQTLINECFISNYPSNFEGLKLVLHAILLQTNFCFAFLGSYIVISDRKVKAKRIETASFHSLGNLKGHTLDDFFYASHISHNFIYKLILISMS